MPAPNLFIFRWTSVRTRPQASTMLIHRATRFIRNLVIALFMTRTGPQARGDVSFVFSIPFSCALGHRTLCSTSHSYLGICPSSPRRCCVIIKGPPICRPISSTNSTKETTVLGSFKVA